MSDEVSPYGTHEHASPRAVHTHALVGEPARLATLDQAIEGTSRAAFSTAPYKPPAKMKPAGGDDTQLNSRTTTRAAGPGETSGSAAAPPAIPPGKCIICGKQWARIGSDYCRHHQPDET